MFLTTLTCVAMMILYSIPGFAVVKGKLVKPEAIPGFAVVLMYVCQPALTVYALTRVDYQPSLGVNALLFVGMVLVILGLFLAGSWLVLHRYFADEKMRVYAIATTFSNCTFMGLPLLEALFPKNPEVLVYSLSFFLAMSILCWTFGSYLISGDRRYISAKKLFLNPAMISIYVAVPLWLCHVKLPGMLFDLCSLLGKMTTPMCMLVLGMRLATVRIKEVFGDPKQYLIIAVNQLVMPLLTFALLYFIPIDPIMKQALLILTATPVASVVQNFAEMIGKGQKTAANCVLLGTMLSVGTIPLVSLLVGYLA